MSPDAVTRYLVRRPSVALLVYAALVCVLVYLAWAALADVNDRRIAVLSTADLLDRLERPRSSSPNAAGAAIPAGSPFLQGKTVTVAGAALLQRVANAVAGVGGNVLSSQVDLQGPQAKDGYISVLASCELTQSALQQVLYDFEAGMPFLYVNQLDVQVPNAEGGQLRVLLTVSGRWQGAK